VAETVIIGDGALIAKLADLRVKAAFDQLVVQARRALWIALPIALIVALVVPWRDMQHHTHWGKVRWIPFVSPPFASFDMLGNILLYVPFGYGFVRAQPLARRRVLVFAALLSVLTEWTQVWSHLRFPSLTDVSCNLLGAWCGMIAARNRK
jgi:glycopeptide antibiotics resistance protein